VRGVSLLGWGVLLALLLVACSAPQGMPPPSSTLPIPSPTATLQPTLSEVPTRTRPPRISLAPLPPVVAPEEGLKVVARAEGGERIVRMELWVDGRLLRRVEGASLRHNIDTRRLPVGEHELLITAEDAAGRQGRLEARFSLCLPTKPVPSPSTPALPSPMPSPTAPPTLPPAPTATPTAATGLRRGSVHYRWGTLRIATYQYRQALYRDPAKAGHPYPLLHHGQVGPPRPVDYRALYVWNEYLELTFLPELGGRLYQCRYLPTGQTLFYNNAVIKPTHWGPEDQGWWLAVGGMEFCLPVEEHGYVTAEPWEPEVRRLADGSVSVVMRLEEESRHLRARVETTLRPGEGGFHLRSTLINPDDAPKAFQYWINAMLAPGGHSVGPELRFICPASEVIVHSCGDPSLPAAHERLPWPVYQGRDLSRYGNWQNWLGFFAPQLEAPFAGVYDEDRQLGVVRVFPPQVAKGCKFFGFGQHFDAQVYTDDGSQYVEMWGGLSPTFWDEATLPPKGQVSWEETWYILSRCGGLSLANREAALYASRQGEQLVVGVCAPGAHRWLLQVLQGGRELVRRPFDVGPGAPFRDQLPLGNSAGELDVRILDSSGRLVLSFTLR